MIEHWFLLPVGFIIATTAMTFGIGGAALFTPFFILAMGLPASVAAGLGLFIEVFGFGSGLIGFARAKLINYRCARFALAASIPAAIIGVLGAQYLPDWAVTTALALALIILGFLLTDPQHKRLIKGAHIQDITDAQDTYKPQRALITRALHGLGGVLAGLTSTGLGEINDYVFLKHYRMRGAVAAGTSVFVVAITALIGSAAHVLHLDPQLMPKLLGMLVWIAPGVIIGAQAGVYLSQHVSDAHRAQFTGALFFAIATSLFATLL